jgi:NAD(P)-dependent dehydrogenase (short-subunit alcohol dehydrogenase family)
MTRWKRAIVVGASTGIGRAVAEALLARGATVAVLARRADLLPDIGTMDGQPNPALLPYTHDVRDTAAVPALFDEIVTRMGGLDILVYAAGVQPVVGPQEYPTETDLTTVTVNLGGAIAWINLAAERFARAREGTIVGIGSVAGDRGRRGNPVYSATKSALDTYLESLRNRLAVLGVTVLTVRPGFVETALLRQFPVPPFVPVATPSRAADDILAAAAADRRIAYIPGWWRYVMLVIRSIPDAIFERLPI